MAGEARKRPKPWGPTPSTSRANTGSKPVAPPRRTAKRSSETAPRTSLLRGLKEKRIPYPVGSRTRSPRSYGDATRPRDDPRPHRHRQGPQGRASDGSSWPRPSRPWGEADSVWAEAHLGWNRETIRKGMHELRTGMTCVDAFHCRRRKPAEEHLPRLLDDIRAIADGQSQADPKFQTKRLFTRISAAEVRRQLIATKGYTDERVAHPADDQHEAQPAGLPPHQGGQVPPPKKVKQTDAIFEQLKRGQPRRPIGPTTRCGSRSTPRPRSTSARSPAGAGAAPGPRRRTTTSSPRRR